MSVCVVGLQCVQVASLTTLKECYTVGDDEHCFLTKLGAQSQRSWADARSYCEQRPPIGWHLMVVTDRRVQSYLAEFLELGDFKGRYGKVWTGIMQTVQGQWSWIDETPYTGIMRVFIQR